MGYDLITSGLLQGLILGFVALGVMIPFRFLNFADLTCEGAYPLGGALCTVLILKGQPPFLALLMASLCAGLLGLATAFLHLKLRINTLLAGIIISTMTYSLNLRFMGKPNLGLFHIDTLFTKFEDDLFFKMGFLFVLHLLIMMGLFLFMNTEKGLRFRAVGYNPRFAERQGIHLKSYIFLGLFLGNILSGFAGAILVQNQAYVDIGMGVGIVIHALAAMMIGETLIKRDTLTKQLLAPFIGALIYQQIQGLALSLGLAPSDLKFLTGLIVIGVLSLQKKEENSLL
jgi:putative tryptophan/tyrosine transport system permease protein